MKWYLACAGQGASGGERRRRGQQVLRCRRAPHGGSGHPGVPLANRSLVQRIGSLEGEGVDEYTNDEAELTGAAESRRDVLKKAAVGGAVVWAAPAVLAGR